MREPLTVEQFNSRLGVGSTSITAGPMPELTPFPFTDPLRGKLAAIIAKWKVERDAKCDACAKGLSLGRHGCHFEDDGEESFSVGNCKAWPLSKRIKELEECL
jgi:hypothetical protein